jgi:hypothetical protein
MVFDDAKNQVHGASGSDDSRQAPPVGLAHMADSPGRLDNETKSAL